MSLSGIKKYLHDALGISVTKGDLVKVLQKGSKALESRYDELLQALPFLGENRFMHFRQVCRRGLASYYSFTSR
jgi:hypothetical protein